MCQAQADLAAALPFNVVSLGDFVSGHSDVEGRLAVGGRLDVWHYGVGLRDPDGVVAAVGGHLLASDAAFHGDVAVAGEAWFDNAGLYREDGTAGVVHRGSGVDFDALAAGLERASDVLSSVAATGPTIAGGTHLRLVGGRPDVNVFRLGADALARTQHLTIEVPDGAHAIINVHGDAVRFQNFGVFPTSLDPSRVLFNAAEARTVRIEAFGFRGSLLAPRASVDFDNGRFDGQLFAGAVLGDGLGDGQPDGQFNHVAYNPPVCVVDEPQPCTMDADLELVRGYNVFVTGDYVAGHSDIEGRLAAGGDIAVHRYSVGRMDPDGLAAVAGLDLSAEDASFHGDVAAAGAIELRRVGLVRTGGARGQAWNLLAEDFEEQAARLEAVSADLGQLAPTARTQVSGRSIRLIGEEHRQNVFVVAAQDLARADRLDLAVPEGTDVVIRVEGEDLVFSNFAVFTDTPASRILFHAPAARTVRIEAFRFWGSLLAPGASVDFDNGQFNGSLFARQFDGDGLDDAEPDGQFNHHPLVSTLCR